MSINYHGKKFKLLEASDNSALGSNIVFEYMQDDQIISCQYRNGYIQYGQLLGLVEENGNIQMSYHQINAAGELMTGTCTSTPEILKDGRIRLHESWQWTNGDLSSGQSILEEILIVS